MKMKIGAFRPLAVAGLLVVSTAGAAPVTLGPEFIVPTQTPLNPQYPSVAGASDGSFIVVWNALNSPGNDSDEYSVQARRYDADGVPLGPQFQVNAYTTSGQFRPRVTI